MGAVLNPPGHDSEVLPMSRMCLYCIEVCKIGTEIDPYSMAVRLLGTLKCSVTVQFGKWMTDNDGNKM